ncbi:hypothetical protein [Leptospira weilii]|uniref:Uncharacterized protein n=1 Tax=Leptospira weilii str. UI 13098 TaxID=1088542 RepID=M6QF09_9LEPT|nr:hypothetical protein [Leptospira weilii]EMN91078.1 hypothetical protein LEP1GSC108_4290 [Leptospira weilii str. UI 13098]UPY78733.1 hypothetical protein FH581_007685 [Leptospira weilii]
MLYRKKIVWDLKEAKSEVNRLNSLNGEDSKYFWQTTKVKIISEFVPKLR